MASATAKSCAAISMRFAPEELRLIDRGAALARLSRTQFMTRAALHDAQMEVLSARMIELSPDGWDVFEKAIAGEVGADAPKLKERLSRRAPWSKD